MPWSAVGGALSPEQWQRLECALDRSERSTSNTRAFSAADSALDGLGRDRRIWPVPGSPGGAGRGSSGVCDPHYRRNAEALRDEITTLPGAEEAVTLLERLQRGDL